ncbi:alpha/beta hydrolase [Pseudonocardia sp.]|uniref:alpha/beta hydrolase n=1 Tax=Pseudonocardia sp. TaxID=60912 RepID=UPI003D147451
MPVPRRLGAVVAGLGAVGVAAWVAVTRWTTVEAGNPAYTWLLVALAVAGVAMLAWSTRARTRRDRGGWNRAVRAVPAIVLVLAAVAAGWLRPFPATAPDPAAGSGADPTVTDLTVTDLTSTIELRPPGPAAGTGFVFYPGARVDPHAYVAILRPVAAAGHLVVIVKPPLGLALLQPSQAAAVVAAHPGIGRWVVGGHSMGGVAAAGYAAAPGSRAAGLVLWASYPSGDLSGRTDLAVTSVSGTADGLTTPADVDASRASLPPSTRFVAVPGAVHADFGDYGPQPGDGAPGIDHTQAQDRIRAATLAALG